jgi:poly(A) polymerase
VPSPDKKQQRKFAMEVVRLLRQAGYEAYWAGGCVRDLLLGLEPKDYDVATSATPEQVQQVFRNRKTAAVGASFGVVVVLGPRRSGQVEVATFRSEGAYLDGRRPSHVQFTSAREDVQRRDFTINGLLYDPLTEQAIDFVGGLHDLQQRVIRAIGDPRQRFEEDKLRMLRAVRFAARFEFQLDPGTRDAIAAMAPQIRVVSAERIAQEMRWMLVDRNRRRAVEMCRELGLLGVLAPQLAPYARPDDPRWQHTLAVLDALLPPEAAGSVVPGGAERSAAREPRQGSSCDAPPGESSAAQVGASSGPPPEALRDTQRGAAHDAAAVAQPAASAEARCDSPPLVPHAPPPDALPVALPERHFPLALAALLVELGSLHRTAQEAAGAVRELGAAWRLSNHESHRAAWLVEHRHALRHAPHAPWSRLQPLLVHPGIAELLALHEAECRARGEPPLDTAYCRQKLALPPQELNPPPLLRGDDLIRWGVPRGKVYRVLLDEARRAQLDGQIATPEEARRLVEQLLGQQRGETGPG